MLRRHPALRSKTVLSNDRYRTDSYPKKKHSAAATLKGEEDRCFASSGNFP